jgi:hypothetical protein
MADKPQIPEDWKLNYEYGLAYLEQPIIEALWECVKQPVGGVIELYDASGALTAINVASDVEHVWSIRDRYAQAVKKAFRALVDELAQMIEATGTKASVAKGDSDTGSPFTRLVYEVLRTAPIEGQVHGVSRIDNRDGHWDALNQAVYRALKEHQPIPDDIVRWHKENTQRLAGLIRAFRDGTVHLEDAIARAERELNLTPAKDALVEARLDAINAAMTADETKTNWNQAGWDAMRAYDAWRMSRWRATQWCGPTLGWSLVAYGVSPPPGSR